jgi:hypothetical protein
LSRTLNSSPLLPRIPLEQVCHSSEIHSAITVL